VAVPHTCMKKRAVSSQAESSQVRVAVPHTCMKKRAVSSQAESSQVRVAVLHTCMKKRAVSSSRVLRPSSRLNVYIEPEMSITNRMDTRRCMPWAVGGGAPRCL
jgi:hypothetical protein